MLALRVALLAVVQARQAAFARFRMLRPWSTQPLHSLCTLCGANAFFLAAGSLGYVAATRWLWRQLWEESRVLSLLVESTLALHGALLRLPAWPRLMKQDKGCCEVRGGEDEACGGAVACTPSFRLLLRVLSPALLASAIGMPLVALG